MKNCIVCKKPLVIVNQYQHGKKYCSGKCSVKAQYKKFKLK